MISEKKAIEIAQSIEHADNIDIKKTIEKATTAGYLGEEHFYCTVIEEGGITHTVPEILGDRYKSQPLDNLYYDIISKALDLDGIYISLGYCNSNIQIPDEECDEIIEYDEYELEEDDYYYLIEHALISASGIKKFRIYEEEGILGHNPTEDMAIMINIIDDEYRAYFALRSTDMCMSNFRIMPLISDVAKEHPLSFKNPINIALIEMINDTIVYKEKEE